MTLIYFLDLPYFDDGMNDDDGSSNACNGNNDVEPDEDLGIGVDLQPGGSHTAVHDDNMAEPDIGVRSQPDSSHASVCDDESDSDSGESDMEEPQPVKGLFNLTERLIRLSLLPSV